MSAKWMRVETDFVDHPKVRRLCTTLGNQQGGWFVLRLWSFMSRFCPTGHLRDIDGTSVETECEWSGTPGKLISALVECEFLDEKKSGGWAVHDWDDHQGSVAAKAQKERERKAEYRRKLRETVLQPVPQLSHGTSAGHPGQRDVTGRDVTKRDVTDQQQAPPISPDTEPPPKASKEKPPITPVAYQKPSSAPSTWTGEDFFSWAQYKRQEVGLVAERDRPRNLGSWYSTALMTLKGDAEMLQEAFYRFGDDPHWKSATPPLPFKAFVSQWDRFVPRSENART